MTFYVSSNILNLLLSINRVFAAYYHQNYISVFKNPTTISILTCIMLISAIYSVLIHEFLDCRFIFDKEKLAFVFADTCSRTIWITNLGVNVTISSLSFALNMACVFKNRIQKSMKMIKSAEKNEDEYKYIRISVIQNVIIIMGQVFYYGLAPLAYPSHPVIFSLLSNFIGCSQAFEPLIIMVYNKIRQMMMLRARSNKIFQFLF